jgi:RNA polymerase sigma-70 factor (ECF subfamily)
VSALRRERRSSAFGFAPEAEEADVLSERFLPAGHPDYPGHWGRPPVDWGPEPERRLLGRETAALIQSVIAGLPEAQAQVMSLRDLAGLSGEEVAQMLSITPNNQRVLLHRARLKLWATLDRHFAEES